MKKSKNLAKHNLYACLIELKRVKQAIHEGRLWELLESKARLHPSMRASFSNLVKYIDVLERYTPISKRRGLFLYDSFSTFRPEAERFRRRVRGRVKPSHEAKVLLLLPPLSRKPYSRNKKVKWFLNYLFKTLGKDFSAVSMSICTATMGPAPLELDEVYPASQHEGPPSINSELIKAMAKYVTSYIDEVDCRVAVYNHDPSLGEVYLKVKESCLKRGIVFEPISLSMSPWSKQSLEEVSKVILNVLNDIKEGKF